MADCEQWQGTPSELLVRLEALVSEDIRRSKFFPKDATRLSKTLKRVQTDLQQFITITSEKRNGTRLISCQKVKNPSVPSVPEAQNPDSTTVKPRDATGTLQNPSVPSVPDISTSGTLQNSQGRYVDATKNLASLPQSLSEQDFQPLRDARDATIHPPFYRGVAVGQVVGKRGKSGWRGQVVRLLSDTHVDVLWDMDKHPTMMAIDELAPLNADKPVSVDWETLNILGVGNHA